MANWNDDFGVIVTCSKFDYLFAKGTCESIRQFMPGVPICLLVDGDFDLGDLPKIYNAQVIRKENVKDPFLKKNSFGWGLTKMIAFWESPFEYFLLLDADTVVYGDVRVYADFDKYDVIVDLPQQSYSEEDISQFYFDVTKISKYFGGFNYRFHPYVCTGVIFARRNVLNIDDYKRFFSISKVDNQVFKCGEQGFLNVCFFYGKEQGKIRLGNVHFQYLIPDYSSEEAAMEFPIPPIMDRSPMVVHWAGKDKPIMENDAIMYVAPMTYFRRKFLEGKGISSPEQQYEILQLEDGHRKKLSNRSITYRIFAKFKALIQT